MDKPELKKVVAVEGPEINGLGIVHWWIFMSCEHFVRLTQKHKPRNKVYACAECTKQTAAVKA